MPCPSCVHENADDASFCGSCGRSLSEEVVCGDCGRPVPTGERFCQGCGNRPTSAELPVPTVTPDASRTNPNPVKNPLLADIVSEIDHARAFEKVVCSTCGKKPVLGIYFFSVNDQIASGANCPDHLVNLATFVEEVRAILQPP